MSVRHCMVWALALLASTAWAVPTGFSISQVTNNLNAPMHMHFGPFEASGRALVVEKWYGIEIVQPFGSTFAKATYLVMQNLHTDDETGCLSVTTDPSWSTSSQKWVYVYWGKSGTNAGMRISRFLHQENQGGLTSRASWASQEELWVDTNGFGVSPMWHYGGLLVWGPDDKLYLGLGDKYTKENAEERDHYESCILRINKDGSIPEGNLPSYIKPAACWAFGFRNPYRLHWDFDTNRLYVASVGGNDGSTSEEGLYIAEAGKHYGWPHCEGACDNPKFPSCNCNIHESPIYSYDREQQGACIIGGEVMRSSGWPTEYQGAYFFADYTRGTIKYLKHLSNGGVSTHSFHTGLEWIVGMETDSNGNLWIVRFENWQSGTLHMVSYSGQNTAPVIGFVQQSASSGQAPLAVTFSHSVTDATDSLSSLTLSWNFGDGNSQTVTAGQSATHTYTQGGTFDAVLTVSDSVTTVNSDPLSVQVGTAPVATIVSPATATSTFRAGDTIDLIATATLYNFATQTNEPLSGNNVQWFIEFIHDSHVHPLGTNPYGLTTQVVVPTSGHTFEGYTGLRFSFAATGPDGITSRAEVVAWPEKVDVVVTSNPIGAAIKVDGKSVVAPHTMDTLIGFQHTVYAPHSHCFANQHYVLSGWPMNPNGYTSTLVVPEDDTTFTIQYVPTGQTCRTHASTASLALQLDPAGTSSLPDTAAPVTSAPVTSAPVTSAPVTSAPVTSAPVTGAPVTDAPMTAAPMTVAPVTSAPITSAPVTLAPAPTELGITPEPPTTAAPATNAPVTSAPITDAPVTDAPITDAPVTAAPITAAPITDAPITDAPVTAAPITDAPVTAAPITAAPITTAPTDVGADPLIVCTDVPEGWMIDQGLSCADMAFYFISNRCNAPLEVNEFEWWWKTNKFCQQTCFDGGAGYDGDNCLPTGVPPPPTTAVPTAAPVTSAPTVVTGCTNVPEPWMLDNALTCDGFSGYIVSNRCNQPLSVNPYQWWWTTNKFCQQTCFDGGSGYDGDDCSGTGGGGGGGGGNRRDRRQVAAPSAAWRDFSGSQLHLTSIQGGVYTVDGTSAEAEATGHGWFGRAAFHSDFVRFPASPPSSLSGGTFGASPSVLGPWSFCTVVQFSSGVTGSSFFRFADEAEGVQVDLVVPAAMPTGWNVYCAIHQADGTLTVHVNGVAVSTSALPTSTLASTTTRPLQFLSPTLEAGSSVDPTTAHMDVAAVLLYSKAMNQGERVNVEDYFIGEYFVTRPSVSSTLPFSTSLVSVPAFTETLTATATPLLSCPAGQVVQSVSFASFGDPAGGPVATGGTSPSSLSASDVGSCHSIDSTAKMARACLGQASCTIGLTSSDYPANTGCVSDSSAATFTETYGIGCCRDADGGQGAGTFTQYNNVDLETCKSYCEASSTCTGIELNTYGTCEIHTMDIAIANGNSICTCQIYNPPVASSRVAVQVECLSTSVLSQGISRGGGGSAGMSPLDSNGFTGVAVVVGSVAVAMGVLLLAVVVTRRRRLHPVTALGTMDEDVDVDGARVSPSSPLQGPVDCHDKDENATTLDEMQWDDIFDAGTAAAATPTFAYAF